MVLGRFPPPVHGQAVATRILSDLLSESGVPIEELNEAYRPPWESKVAVGGGLDRLKTSVGVVKFVLTLRKAMRRTRPSVIIYGGLSATRLGHARNLLTYSLAIPRDSVVLAVVHNGDVATLARDPLTRATWRWICSRTSCLVTLSPTLARTSGVMESSQIEVIPNTVDVPMDRGCGHRAGVPEWAPLELLFLGNLLPEKGVHLAIDAVHLLEGRGRSVRLRIAGAAPSKWEEDRVRLRCRATKAITVEYLGAVHDREALRELVCTAHALVMPTSYRHEALPMVIIEAMACGTPVVATPRAGIPDLIDHGETGFLVPEGDPRAIADRLDELAVPTTWVRLSGAARRKYERELSRAAVATKWRQLLERVTMGDHQRSDASGGVT